MPSLFLALRYDNSLLPSFPALSFRYKLNAGPWPCYPEPSPLFFFISCQGCMIVKALCIQLCALDAKMFAVCVKRMFEGGTD